MRRILKACSWQINASSLPGHVYRNSALFEHFLSISFPFHKPWYCIDIVTCLFRLISLPWFHDGIGVKTNILTASRTRQSTVTQPLSFFECVLIPTCTLDNFLRAHFVSIVRTYSFCCRHRLTPPLHTLHISALALAACAPFANRPAADLHRRTAQLLHTARTSNTRHQQSCRR